MKRGALVVALGLALALAFAAGLWLGGRGGGTEDARPPPQGAATREVFSPKVLSDPYFLEQQRQNVAALERACAERGELCAEARAARRWLDEQAP